MNRIFFKSIAVLIIILAIPVIPQISLAASGDILIPGDTDDEWNINEGLLESNDEDALISYLSDSFASVRMTAANRLSEIGTSASLTPLEQLATTDTDYRVKDASSLSLWNIRYRECISAGGSWTALLLPIFNNDTDTTKTAYVKIWAMGILGKNGCTAALPALQAILDDTTFNTYEIILKEQASSMKALINFLSSFSPSANPMVIVEQGLTHAELAVRIWSLNKLVELKPADLIDRLKTLLRQAQVNDDTGFILPIAHALDKEEEYNRYPPLEIEFPQDGATVKTASIKVMGYSYGEPFDEDINLSPGANTYTKTVTRDGVTTTRYITINYINAPPVLASIGNKTVAPGQTLNFTLQTSDSDDTNLLYFTDPYPLPDRMSFDYPTHTFTYTPTVADIGNHTITFMVDDGYGLKDSETVIITVNSMGPQVTITSPLNNSYVPNTGFSFKGTANGAVEVRVYAYNYASRIFTVNNALAAYNYTTKQWSYLVSASKVTADSSVYLMVKAKDSQGNWSDVKTSYVKVIRMPEVSIDSPAHGSVVPHTGFTVAGNVTPGSLPPEKLYLQVRDYDQKKYTVREEIVLGTTQWSYFVSENKMRPGDALRIYVYAKDAEGNISFTKSVQVDVSME